MNVRATAKFVSTSSRKAGLVAALIRGRSAAEASNLLAQTPKRAGEPLAKVLKSAVANAENNYNLKPQGLTVTSVLVGPGPTLKRFRPRAQGRAVPIRKRTSHITVVLSDQSSRPQTSAADQKQETNGNEVKPTATKQRTATKKETA